MSGLGFVRDARGALTCGGRRVDELVASAKAETPVHVYDLDAMSAVARSLAVAVGSNGLCAYAIKANGAGPIVKTLLAAGCGIDVVSGGELRVALACGAQPASIVYSGVAKRDDELDLAIDTGIKAIHVESVEEIERIGARARARGKTSIPIAIRLNPSVEVDTHKNIATGHDEAKFGIAVDDLPRALDAIRAAGVKLIGISSHVGSQLMTTDPYVTAAVTLCAIARDVRGRGFPMEYVDTGGGFGVPYRDGQQADAPDAFVRAARRTLDEQGCRDLALVIEPGRALVAAYGVLVSKVIQPKRSSAGGVARRWLLIDAGMNDLIRPALYQAHHRIEPLERTPDANDANVSWRVAGPVCESSDDFGEHPLPDPPPPVVVVRESGAYGRAMASGYNARARTGEIFVSKGEVVAVRPSTDVHEIVREEMGVV